MFDFNFHLKFSRLKVLLVQYTSTLKYKYASTESLSHLNGRSLHKVTSLVRLVQDIQ